MTASKQFLAQLATFTVSSASATVGAVYTSGGYTFTVLSTIASKTTLITTASGIPAPGTLTKVTGTGDSTITFSAVTVANAYADALNTSGFEGQTDYSEYAKIGIVGMPYDIAEVVDNVSPVAYETIGLGLGIVRMPSYTTPGQLVARLPRANFTKIILSADLVSGDVVNLTINGVAIAAVTAGGTPATDILALATAIEAHADIDEADVDRTDTSNRTILIYSKDGKDCILAGWAVTVHSTTLSITNTLSTTDLILGLSMQTQGKEQQLGSLILNYVAGNAVNCRRVGRLWVFAEVAVAANDPVYVRLQDGTTTIGGVAYATVRGGLRNDSDSGTCVLVPNWFFWQGCTDTNNGLAVVQTR
jgi:hypothetical protein